MATRAVQALACRASAATRRGDAAWGRRTLAQRGWRAFAGSYPHLLALWRENGWRTRWGYPLIEVPSVALIKAPKRSKSAVTVQRGRETSR